MEQITLKLENFTGPLSLLYHLIEKSKIDIYDIPIAEVTRQYMAVIDDAKSRNMDIMSEFLVMAATLIEIKSRMLLPKNENSEEEKPDPREELVKRLIEYRKYVSFAEKLKERESYGFTVLYKKPDPLIEEIRKNENNKKFLNGITFDDLEKALEDVYKRNENKIDHMRSGFKKVERDQFTIEEKVQYLKDLLYVTPKVIFADIFRNDTLRSEIAVTFLALLELIKNGYVLITQKKIFGDIIIVKNNGSDVNEA
ncbi:MAG: segregation/condensation protein A [Clostridia bacterium]|jgi:segregation and condensation protein A|nr:segregation/condensation protein A [Clostridia bacterium]MCI2001051.1 segregation/condensation protein A [Clostridia bacterium]MCI2015650.1 segregation/condensation protein A [Clostridia bacterium]